MKGRFIVITGPSAAGKTRLVEALLERLPQAARLITITTRAPRPHEKNEVDYYFVSRKDFEERLAAGEFFEHAEVYGNLYGSSKKVLDQFLDKFPSVFAVIDVQGAHTLKTMLPESVVIFLRPGSSQDVERRLKEEREDVPADEMEKRIKTVDHELSLAKTFDQIIENVDGKFDETVENTLQFLKERQ